MMKKINVVGVILSAVILYGGTVAAQPLCPLGDNVPKPREVGSLESLYALPVQDEGRIKPFDSYARNVLLRFSGRTTFEKKRAADWLARVLFAPDVTRTDAVFLINHPEIPEALGVPVVKRRRYSYAQIEPGFNKLAELAKMADGIEEKERSIVEQEILRVYHNIYYYANLTNVMTFAFPHADFQIPNPDLQKQLGLPTGKLAYSFLDVFPQAEALHALTGTLEQKAKEDWTEEDTDLYNLLVNLFNWSMFYKDLPVKLIPPSDAHQEDWLSPWDAISQEFRRGTVKDELIIWQQMVNHYWMGEQLAFDLAAKSFRALSGARLSVEQGGQVKKISLELLYNRVQFLLWAKILYGLAFILGLLAMFRPRSWLRWAVLGIVIAGLLPQTAAIIIRMILMGRPPVTNLYETFVFVSFIGVVFGLIIEFFNKEWLGILVSSVCGLAFLMIASKFAAEGDTLQMLVAVLNSNFWLSTHVLSITIGYAGCCVAGVIGHIYILQALIRPKDKTLLANTSRHLIGAMGFGLMMTFVGTILGGIWADQSWGRFWGWDPKENGALMIVLWCAMVFHAKISRSIGMLGFAAGSVLSIIVVLWAWFGVNLLSIGLHSYGFTSGVAYGLLAGVVFEVLFVIVLVPIAKKRQI